MPLTLGDSCLVMDLAITYDDEAEVKKLYVNGELAVESNDAVAEKIPITGRNPAKPAETECGLCLQHPHLLRGCVGTAREVTGTGGVIESYFIGEISFDVVLYRSE